MFKLFSSVNKKNDSFFEQIAAVVPVNIYTFNLSGIVTWCNSSQLEFFCAQDSKVIVGKAISDLLPEEEARKIKEINDQVIVSAKTVREEEWLTNGAGRRRLILTHKSPLFSDDCKRVIGVVGVGVDITELKEMQEQLKEALVKSEVAVNTHRTIFQNIKHHWITAISNVLVPIRMLKMDHQDNAESLEMIEMSEEGVEQLRKHIKDIMDLVESGEGIPSIKCAPFNLKQLAENVYKMFKPTIFAKKTEFMLDIDDAPELARGDQYRIERVMIFLLSNALKFDKNKDGKNKVLFSIKVTEETEKNYNLNLVVKDAGRGMSDDEVARIYEPFYRVGDSNQTIHNNPDQGVGLTVTKQYIEDIDGQIDCKSRLGEGTVFMVAFRLMKSINSQEVFDSVDI